MMACDKRELTLLCDENRKRKMCESTQFSAAVESNRSNYGSKIETQETLNDSEDHTETYNKFVSSLKTHRECINVDLRDKQTKEEIDVSNLTCDKEESITAVQETVLHRYERDQEMNSIADQHNHMGCNLEDIPLERGEQKISIVRKSGQLKHNLCESVVGVTIPTKHEESSQGNVFEKDNIVTKHEKTHGKDMRHNLQIKIKRQCKICNKRLLTVSSILNHMSLVHHKYSDMIQYVTTNYECDLCSTILGTRELSALEYNMHLCVRPMQDFVAIFKLKYICTKCSFSCDNLQQIAMHVKTVHVGDNIPVDPMPVTIYLCQYCKCTLISSEACAQHMTQCVTSRDQLNREDSTTSESVIHKCPFCSSLQDSLMQLEDHIEVCFQQKISVPISTNKARTASNSFSSTKTVPNSTNSARTTSINSTTLARTTQNSTSNARITVSNNANKSITASSSITLAKTTVNSTGSARTTLYSKTSARTTHNHTSNARTVSNNTNKPITASNSTTLATTNSQTSTNKATSVPSSINKATSVSSSINQATSAPSSINKATSAPSSINKATSAPSSINKATSAPSSINKATSAPSSINKATSVPCSVNQATSAPSSINKATTASSVVNSQSSDMKMHSSTQWMKHSAGREETCTRTKIELYSIHKRKAVCPVCQNVFTLFKNFKTHIDLLHADLNIQVILAESALKMRHRLVSKCNVCTASTVHTQLFLNDLSLAQHMTKHSVLVPLVDDKNLDLNWLDNKALLKLRHSIKTEIKGEKKTNSSECAHSVDTLQSKLQCESKMQAVWSSNIHTSQANAVAGQLGGKIYCSKSSALKHTEYSSSNFASDENIRCIKQTKDLKLELGKEKNESGIDIKKDFKMEIGEDRAEKEINDSKMEIGEDRAEEEINESNINQVEVSQDSEFQENENSVIKLKNKNVRKRNAAGGQSSKIKKKRFSTRLIAQRKNPVVVLHRLQIAPDLMNTTINLKLFKL